MLYNYPTIIVDNFFKDPSEVRKFALTQEYTPCPEGNFSGVRTKNLFTDHPRFFQTVSRKILDCYSLRYTSFAASMHFHWTGEDVKSGGWVHRDRPIVLASIIYLNETNNSVDNGTGLYKLSNLNEWDKDFSKMKESFRNPLIKQEGSELHNLNYTPILKVGNLFNRMLSYDGYMPHAGENYFGNSKDTGRLTLVTFFRQINFEDNMSPLQRADLLSDL